jgi:predicted secreted protein
MTLVGGLAVYFVIWWIALLAVLPFGVRTLAEEGTVGPGQAPSAPARPRLLLKLGLASVLAGLVWLLVVAVVEHVGLDAIPFLPRFEAIG